MDELKFYGDTFGISKKDLLSLQDAIIEALKDNKENREFIAFSIDYDKKSDWISMNVAYYSEEDKEIETTAIDGYLRKILNS